VFKIILKRSILETEDFLHEKPCEMLTWQPCYSFITQACWNGS